MTKMRIYVGTHHKYNNGSIEGKWMDLDDYADAKEFIEACKELHKDEEYPELMFQDWEGIPDRLAGEWMDMEDVYDYLDNMKKASNPEAFEAWVDHMGGDDYNDFEDAYQGEYDSEEDFADELASDLGYYKAMRDAGLSESYFDLDAFARDLFISDYTYVDGYVFRNL
jgi:antirestriction protein